MPPARARASVAAFAAMTLATAVLLGGAHAQTAAPAAEATGTAAAGSTSGSAAELLFERSHFDDLSGETVLDYRYERRTSDPERLGGDVDDEIHMTVSPLDADGKRTVAVDMFTGPRRRAAGPFPEMIGNPLLMLFLEADVSGMKTLVGGNPRYLKNKIRAAFRAGGTNEPTTVTIGGEARPARRIVLQPFADDEHRTELGAFIGKTYEFVVSDEVPGMIVSIRTTTPPIDGGTTPYFEEEIRFVGTDGRG